MTTKVKVLKTSVTLTSMQLAILSTIIEQVDKCLEWDDLMNCYTDQGNFVLSIPKGAMKSFKELTAIFD